MMILEKFRENINGFQENRKRMRKTNNLPSRLAHDDMPLLHQEATIGCLVRTNLSKINLIHLRASALLPVSAYPGNTRAKRHDASLRFVELKIATVGNLTRRQLPS